MKRIVTITLAMVMLLSFAMPAFAGPFNPEAQYGSITVTKLLKDRVPTGEPDHFGNQLVDTDFPEGTPLEGISFTATRVVPDTTQTGEESATRWLGPDGLFYIAATSPAYSQTVVTDVDGEAVFGIPNDPLGTGAGTKLPLGIYRIVELQDTTGKVVDPSQPFFVSVPTINDAGVYLDNRFGEEGDDDYLYDVFAYPKNENINITKEIFNPQTPFGAAQGAGVSIGDTVQYLITFDIPSDIENARHFAVTDHFSQGLQFVGINRVTIIRASDDSTQNINPPFLITNATTHKDLGGNVVTGSDIGTNDGGSFTLDMGTTWRTNYLYVGKKAEILVTFRVTDQASLTSPIPNRAELNYTNRWGHEHERQSNQPKVYTGGIRIFKHDSVITTMGLEGAWFALVPWVEGQTFAEARGAKLAEGFVGEDEHVGIEFDQYAGFYTQNGEILYARSGADGVLEFRGLPYGSVTGGVYTPSPTKYWLVEVVAPDGYRLPAGTPKVIDIFGESTIIGINGDEDEIIPASWTNKLPIDLDVKVGNVKGFNFPLTGGTGTVMFAVAAMALAAMAYGLNRLGKKEAVKA